MGYNTERARGTDLWFKSTEVHKVIVKNLKPESAERVKDISIRAVIIGLLADIGGTFVFSLVFGILAMILLAATNRDIRQLDEFVRTPVFMTLTTIIGLLFTAFGGYVTARAAKKAEMKNALVMGLFSAALGVMLAVALFNVRAFVFNLTIQLSTIPFAMLGAYVFIKTRTLK